MFGEFCLKEDYVSSLLFELSAKLLDCLLVLDALLFELCYLQIEGGGSVGVVKGKGGRAASILCFLGAELIKSSLELLIVDGELLILVEENLILPVFGVDLLLKSAYELQQ